MFRTLQILGYAMKSMLVPFISLLWQKMNVIWAVHNHSWTYLINELYLPQLGHSPIIQDLRIEELEKKAASMAKQIEDLGKKVVAMAGKIEKLQKKAKPLKP